MHRRKKAKSISQFQSKQRLTIASIGQYVANVELGIWLAARKHPKKVDMEA
jgi:hypothetical protein